jgi:Zn-dependent protease
VAGVGANFALAFACAALLVLTALLISTISPGRQLPELSQLFSPITADWIPGGVLTAVWIEILKAGIIVNLVLASFNLLPFPPLDGSHLLRLILPQRAANVLDKLSAIGMLLLLVLIISNALDYIFLPGLVIAAYLTYLPGMLFSL